MRTRNYDWVDIETGRHWFGVQVFLSGKWRNCHDDGQPCIYPDAVERDAKRAELRQYKEATT